MLTFFYSLRVSVVPVVVVVCRLFSRLICASQGVVFDRLGGENGRRRRSEPGTDPCQTRQDGVRDRGWLGRPGHAHGSGGTGSQSAAADTAP